LSGSGDGGNDFVLGIDLGGSKAALAVATLDARQLASERLEYGAEAIDAAGVVDRALMLGLKMIETAIRKGRGNCRAVGIVCPGIVRDHGVCLAPSRPGWENVQVLDRARSILGIETVVAANDVKAAALAEYERGSLRGANPALYVNLGTGISAALVVDGRVVGGAHQGAGEIGYMPSRAIEPSQSATSLLEERAGGGGIGRNVSRLLGRTVSAAQAFAAGEPVVKAYLEEVLYEIALAVVKMTLLVDPARIAVGGGLMESGGVVFDALNEQLDRLPFRPDLVRAHFLTSASLEGAVSLALAQAGESRSKETWVNA
jgi:glucokinase